MAAKRPKEPLTEVVEDQGPLYLPRTPRNVGVMNPPPPAQRFITQTATYAYLSPAYPKYLPDSRLELKLGMAVDFRFDSFTIVFMGETIDQYIPYDVWWVIRNARHTYPEAAIYVNPKTGKTMVRNKDDEDIFDAYVLKFKGKKLEMSLKYPGTDVIFGTISDQGTVNKVQSSVKTTLTHRDKDRLVFSTKIDNQKPIVGFAGRFNPTTVTVRNEIDNRHPINKALVLMHVLKYCYELGLSDLPHPREILYRQEPSHPMQLSADEMMACMLCNMTKLHLRPALNSCKQIISTELLDEQGTVLLTFEFLDFENSERHEGALEVKDNFGDCQLKCHGLGELMPLRVYKAYKLNEQKKLLGTIELGANNRAEFKDGCGKRIMFQTNIEETKIRVEYNESLPNNFRRHYFDINEPHNYDVNCENGNYRVATIRFGNYTTTIDFVADLTLRNDWKALILVHALKFAYHDHKLLRLAPMVCNSAYAFRPKISPPKTPSQPANIDWTKLAQDMGSINLQDR